MKINVNSICILMLLMVSVSFAAVIDEAKLYFPFEGEDTGIAGECWKNQGTVAFGEGPSVLRDFPDSDPPTVTSDGLKGQAYDGTVQTYYQLSDVYVWGTPEPNEPDTAIESVLEDMQSFTLTFWMKEDASHDQGRPFMCTVFHINARKDYLEIWFDEGPFWQKSSLSPKGFPKTGQWRFAAIVYDSSDDPNELKFYSGNEDNTVELNHTIDLDYGILETNRDFGVVFAIGNYDGTENSDNGPHPTWVGTYPIRPFIGYLDEMRLWSSQMDSSGALSIEDIEYVRRFDIQECVGGVMDGDIDGDCKVDGFDLAFFAQDWYSSNPKP